MKPFRIVSYIIAGVGMGWLVSCAMPIAPSGGPPDKTAPVLEFTIPKSGTTNFDGKVFEFQFDEFINRSSVANAITVEPDLGIRYHLSWKRKNMKIEFEDDFPDSTTMILKLGTNISDTRGNKLPKPITVAISTGDEIDGGVITGKILRAESARGAANQRVLLYRQPMELTQKANYEAQTDTGGTFTFSYLAEGNYKALLVDDRNRNKQWDAPRESAYPFYREFIPLEKNKQDTLDVIYTMQVDSIAPELQGVGLFSQNRMRLRFSENVELQEDSNLMISDSLGEEYSSAYPLYISPKEPFVLFAQSEKILEEELSYSLEVRNIIDEAGNVADTSAFDFSGTAQEDTTQQRIISVNGKGGLTQKQSFGITYATPITDADIVDSLVVIEGDVDFQQWPEIQIVRNKLLIKPQEEWIAGIDYQFLVWNPVTRRRKMFKPQVWDSTEYGEIEIVLTQTDSAATFIGQLKNAENEQIRSASFDSSLTFRELPPKAYTLVVFKDENGDLQWNRGTAIPYKKPEPYYVQRALNVQEGFTSQVQITFK